MTINCTTLLVIESIYMQIIQNMRAQDKFSYDATVVGLNGIYHTIGENSFYINSKCILATEKIITTGKTK